jgi:DNA-binding GntR family transcriptional regulator
VTELGLAADFGTSQAPVREALRELSNLGLVEIRPNIGTRIRVVDAEAISEVYPVRAALESLAVRLGGDRLVASLPDLRAEVETMVVAARRGDTLATARSSVDFHELLISAAGSGALTRAWSGLGVEVVTPVVMQVAGVDLLEVADSHRPLIAAIEAGDMQEVSRAVEEHELSYVNRPTTSWPS